jgi:hypothetical protein
MHRAKVRSSGPWRGVWRRQSHLPAAERLDTVRLKLSRLATIGCTRRNAAGKLSEFVDPVMAANSLELTGQDAAREPLGCDMRLQQPAFSRARPIGACPAIPTLAALSRIRGAEIRFVQPVIAIQREPESKRLVGMNDRHSRAVHARNRTSPPRPAARHRSACCQTKFRPRLSTKHSHGGLG